MPLFKRIKPNPHTSIVLWQIAESEGELMSEINLSKSDESRYHSFTKELKRKEFLAVRHSVKNIFGETRQLLYNSEGKPFLENGPHISVSHTKGFAGVIVSSKQAVGIDLELEREQIARIAPKFIRPAEEKSLHAKETLAHLTHYWGAKECLVKITGNRKLDFIKQLHVQPFDLKHPQETTALIQNNDKGPQQAQLFFDYLHPVYLTYGWENTAAAIL